jgi:hypothetical protein
MNRYDMVSEPSVEPGGLGGGSSVKKEPWKTLAPALQRFTNEVDT